MKYDAQITQLKEKIAAANRILVVLPIGADEDRVGAALSLYLALKNVHKPVSIVSSSPVSVPQTLTEVAEISQQIPPSEGGNLILTLEGVVDDEGKVTSLEKLDWYPEGNNLNLVFHVLSGKVFEPKSISTMRSGAEFDLVFVIGASTPADLGELFMQNSELFYKATKVNIDKGKDNSLFGQINIVDSEVTSLSEMMMQILTSLSLPLDSEAATALIAGIFQSTHHLTQNITAETFLTVGNAMQSGGKLPGMEETSSQPSVPDSKPVIHPRKEASNGNISLSPTASPQPTSVVPDLTPSKEVTETQTSPAAEETPVGEQAISTTAEGTKPTPDWLSPKVYKGRSLG